MKITKIPNFGSFGVYVDNVDMNNISSEEWIELGKLFVNELLVIFRDINMSKQQFLDYIPQWGPLKSIFRLEFYKKYGMSLDVFDSNTWQIADEEDQNWLKVRRKQLEKSGDGRYLTRIYGRKDAHGNSLGYFSTGDVKWHIDDPSSLFFTPGAALLGWQAMDTSATCFVQTIDLYESLNDSFRQELDEMILVHEYIPGRVNENELTDPSFSLHMKKSFCPIDGSETPLVVTAPNGRKGLRYTVNSIARIKDISQPESDKILAQLNKLIFDNKWIHNHWYKKNNKDLVCWDNSVTIHKRIAGKPDRKAFRQQFDLSPLLDKAWEPWKQHPEYHKIYKHDIAQLVNLVGGDLRARFKLP